jgi:YfiH family protein
VISFQNKLGFGFRDENILAFFGNINAELAQLQNEFPNLEFLRVKQTHSDLIVEASAILTEADAHWTSSINKSLLIATADCMPILIFCQQTRRTAAVHAGWRGVVNKITEKTLNLLVATGSSKKDFQIFVGPSILQNSFEVDHDVYEKIKTSSYKLPENEYCEFNNNKYYINLNKVVLSQIQNVSDDTKVNLSLIDTKTDQNFYSYRRGKLKSERNLSFIALLK